MSIEKIEQQVTRLLPLVKKLKEALSFQDKILLIDTFLSSEKSSDYHDLIPFFSSPLDSEEEFVIKAVIVMDQAPIIFNFQNISADYEEKLQSLIQHLVEIENFYIQLGGLIGYHLHFLSLILEQQHAKPSLSTHYTPPEGLFCNQELSSIRQSIRDGIQCLDQTAIFLPIGGAGDRLNLVEEITQQPLPAAILPFLGRTLLEGIIRDLQAYEHLFYKLHHQRIHIPISLMTSQEKNNHQHVYEIIVNHQWFGRPQESFLFFMQPLVPVITQEGNWSLTACLTLTLKPGGHGVMWKLAQDEGIIQKLTSQGYYQAFVRQINNPLASTDAALLALIGLGTKQHKSLGFLSCERILHASEGANVLIEEKTDAGYCYCISNIEYTDFDKKGIGEIPFEEGSIFSKYPSNTNILYVNMQSIEKSLESCSIPGALINMKTLVPYIDENGLKTEIQGGRLECTMQNIADYMMDEFPQPLEIEKDIEQLSTYILFSDRIKTISPTKKSFKKNESSLGTPEQAYYDIQQNNRELFVTHCLFTIPKFVSFDIYLEQGPNCFILFHPALGPLYSIVAQKIRKGRLAENAELQLEVAEIDIENLDLEGSLFIESLDPLGLMSNQEPPRCTLKNIKVCNQGINRQQTKHYWKNQMIHHEYAKIILHEGSEFYAENLTISGHQIFEVPAYHCMIVTSQTKNEKIEIHLTAIQSPSWSWNYDYDKENRICLTKVHT